MQHPLPRTGQSSSPFRRALRLPIILCTTFPLRAWGRSGVEKFLLKVTAPDKPGLILVTTAYSRGSPILGSPG